MRATVVMALMAALPSAAGLFCDPGMSCVCEKSPCDIFQCSAEKACDQAVLVCDSSHCDMDCSGKESCKQSHLQCLSDYCKLDCTRDQSCQQMKTYADSGILTASPLDPIGRGYGIWMSARASDGKLVCDGDQSCQQTTVGCASDKCELTCNGQQACQQAGYDVKSSSEGALVRCMNKQSCQEATLDFEDIGGDAELVCDKELGCTQATVVCPSRHSLVVRCNGVKSCEQMTLRAPSTMLPGQRCHLECVGQLACSGIDQSRVTGGVTATCSSGAGCPGFLQPNTVAPTPVPTPAATIAPCSGTWSVKVAAVTLDCNNLCTVLLDVALCNQLCECVPATAAPTPVPAPVPTAAPATIAPCSGTWSVKVSVVTLDCNNLCTVLLDVSLCNQLCECVPATAAPTPVPAPLPTAAPATIAPCDNWSVKLVGSSANCNNICKVLLDVALCNQLCECAPATPVPAPVPTAAPATIAPCSGTWSVKVAAVTLDCNNLCTVLLDVSLCNQLCECTPPATAAPTPVPAPVATPVPRSTCSSWKLKVVSIIPPVNCDTVCTGILAVASCTQFCECADTVSPGTALPATAAPSVIAPCDNWSVKLVGSSANCNNICKVLLDVALCNQLCECAPATPVPAPVPTAAPATIAPCSGTWSVKVAAVTLDCTNLCTVLLDVSLCNQLCECTPPATAAPTPVPAPVATSVPRSTCSSWKLKVVSIIPPVNCDTVCTGILAVTSCTQFCECADTTAPATPLPTLDESPQDSDSPVAVDTEAPSRGLTDAPLPVCKQWKLKILTATINCDTVCTGLLNVAACTQFCECADTAVPPTALPSTAAPATLSPLPNCSNWQLKVFTATISCDTVCTGLLNIDTCRQFCVCVDTAAPATAVPATAAPATLVPVPSTPVPGTVNIIKKLFRITLRSILSLFNRTAFLRALLRLLGKMVRSVKVHWTCPASACVNGCPRSSVRKLNAGCRPLFSSTDRLADMLADTSGGVVLEFDADYTEDGSEALVEAALQQEQAQPTELAEFKLEGVDVVESEVMEVETTARDEEDDTFSTEYIILIVTVCLAAVVALVVLAFCCVRKHLVRRNPTNLNAKHIDEPYFTDVAV